MSEHSAEPQFRIFLLVVPGLIFVGTAVELLLTEHDESFIQLIPYVLCGIGAIAVLAALTAPGRATLLVLRGVAILLLLGSLYGMYEHVAHNVAFELEIRPGASASDVLWEALKGASPLFAPGILGLAGILAAAATYRHPLLRRPSESKRA